MAKNKSGKTTGGNGGTEASDDDDLAPVRSLERKPLQEDFAGHMIAKYGTAERALNELGSENASYRDRHRTDAEQIERLQDRVTDGGIPEGGKVLTKEETADWDKFTKLGKADDVVKKVEDGTKAITTLAERETGDHISTVAEAAGYNAAVLKRLATQDNLVLSIVEQTVDGEKVPVAMVAKKAGDTPTPLTDYATANYKEFIPALEASDTDGDSSGRTTERKERVVPALGQHTARRQGEPTKDKKGSASDGVKAYRNKAYGNVFAKESEQKK